MDDERVKVTAKKLARGAGFSEAHEYRLGDGFSVPTWVTFVSRARQLEQEREAFK